MCCLVVGENSFYTRQHLIIEQRSTDFVRSGVGDPVIPNLVVVVVTGAGPAVVAVAIVVVNWNSVLKMNAHEREKILPAERLSISHLTHHDWLRLCSMAPSFIRQGSRDAAVSSYELCFGSWAAISSHWNSASHTYVCYSRPDLSVSYSIPKEAVRTSSEYTINLQRSVFPYRNGY